MRQESIDIEYDLAHEILCDLIAAAIPQCDDGTQAGESLRRSVDIALQHLCVAGVTRRLFNRKEFLEWHKRRVT